MNRQSAIDNQKYEELEGFEKHWIREECEAFRDKLLDRRIGLVGREFGRPELATAARRDSEATQDPADMAAKMPTQRIARCRCRQ